MRAGSDFKQLVGWLMLTLALLVGVNPIALADRDSSHFGGKLDPSSFHAHHGDDSDHHKGINSAYAGDHHDAYCTDHCCSDTCAAALQLKLPTNTALQNPLPGFLATPAGPPPVEERLIPPRHA